MRCFLKVALVLWLFAPSLAAEVTFTNLHSFLVTTLGSRPLAPLALGSDGNLYGTASAGGTNGGQGTLYRITTNGAITLLHSFTGSADGGDVESALTQGTNGEFYGTTRGGGVYSSGTVFKISTNGVLTSLVQFTGSNDGSTPVGGLVPGQDGNFYGATQSGGAHGFGTVFKLTPAGQLTTLFAFDTNNGSSPLAPLSQGRDGSLYGTTTGAGTYSKGTVFRITTNGAFVVLRALGASPSDPQNPKGPLVQGTDGVFYGTAYDGGVYGLGCLFKITTNGDLALYYSFGTVSNLNGQPLDGSHPAGGLVFGSGGNLYGTTESGGANDLDSGGDGTIFKISNKGVLTTLYSFQSGTDGAVPDAGLLVIGTNMYGTASQGGVAPLLSGNGAIFRVGMNGGFAFIYDFPGLDGLNPSAELTLDGEGNLYGTTEYGGLFGQGTVFKYRVNGAYTVLTHFSGANGSVPDGQLFPLTNGSFLGTTLYGGANSYGTVFKVTTNGLVTMIYNFGSVINGGIPMDGDQPWAGVTLAPDGNCYGTTYRGGAQDGGVLFGVNTNGTLTTLIPFDDQSGGFPQGANLVPGPDGNLYGTTFGSVFRYTPGGASLNILYMFSAGTDGSEPRAGLALGLDGCFYGTTMRGGNYGSGTIFKITLGGQLTTLYSFDGTNGAQPQATLARDSDGTFYGTTFGGGAANKGVIFRFRTDGTYANLHSFTGSGDGAYPDCGLTFGVDGNLYGVAEFGGAGGNGTLFELIVRDPAPVLLSIAPASNAVALSWSAVTGRVYQLQFSANLVQNFWSNLGLPVPATNSVVVATDPLPSPARRFYRVVMLP